MKWPHEIIATSQRQKRIVQIDFRDPWQSAQNNILNAGLSSSCHRDGIAVTAEASGNPENFDLRDR